MLHCPVDCAATACPAAQLTSRQPERTQKLDMIQKGVALPPCTSTAFRDDCEFVCAERKPRFCACPEQFPRIVTWHTFSSCHFAAMEKILSINSHCFQDCLFESLHAYPLHGYIRMVKKSYCQVTRCTTRFCIETAVQSKVSKDNYSFCARHYSSSLSPSCVWGDPILFEREERRVSRLTFFLFVTHINSFSSSPLH